MKISKVTIRNVLGIDELEFEPGGFTSVEGENGTGKTSVLDALKSAFKSGHDATLLRVGAEKGEVVVVLDDGMEITKTISADASTTTIKQDGKRIGRPAEMISSLVDLLSVNPIEFLTARKKDRVTVLLESMPMEVDAVALSKVVGRPVKAQPGAHALDVISAIRKQIFDDRTGTNRAVTEKQGTINQIKLAMPDGVDGVDGSEDEIAAKLDAANQAKDAELKRIADKLDGIKAETNTNINAIRAKLQEDIDALKAVASAAADEVNAKLADFSTKAGIQREKTINKHAETIAPFTTALTAIKTNRNAAAKREQAIETVRMMEEELAGLVEDAAAQTRYLDAIDAYKETLLAELPIPGLEIVDGEIYSNSVHFDRLNTASKVDIAVEIAKLRAGKLGVVCVDGIEALDTESFGAFRDKMLETDLQMFVSRVGDGEFQINTTD